MKCHLALLGGDSNLYGYVLGDLVNLVDPRGEFAFLIPVIVDLAVAYSAYVALHDPLENLGHAISDWWNGYSTWDVPACDENGVRVCYANRSGAGLNDSHGDGDREEKKANKQIEDLLNKLKNASGREAKK